MKLFVVFLLLPVYISAQEINGKGVDTPGAPLAHASVFISNTSLGTITNENGEFVIHKTPDDEIDFVIVCRI